MQAEPIDSDSDVEDHHSPPPPEREPSIENHAEFAKVCYNINITSSYHVTTVVTLPAFRKYCSAELCGI